MPHRSTSPQRLLLHPALFGQAFPESADSRPEWLPSAAFVSVTLTDEEYSILCPQEFIPPAVAQVKGLRVLVLHPGGPMISEVVSDIDEDLRDEGIPASATCNSRFDLGFVVVSDEDLPRVSELLAESGHSVERPGGPAGEHQASSAPEQESTAWTEP